MFIHYSLWLKRVHSSERNLCSWRQMGSEGRRPHRQNNKAKKNLLPTAQFLLTLVTVSVFTLRELEEEAFNVAKTKLHLGRKDPNTAIWLPPIGSQSQTGPLWRLRMSHSLHRVDELSPPCGCRFPFCPASSPSQKSPAGLHYPLFGESYRFQNTLTRTRRTAEMFWKGLIQFACSCGK